MRTDAAAAMPRVRLGGVMASSGSARPGMAEPSQHLRSLLDLPLRFPLPPPITSAINGLGSRLRPQASSRDWQEVYASAIAILQDLLADLDGRLDAFQHQALAVEDPNEVRQRLSQVPRREAERLRAEAKSNLQKILYENAARAKRQEDEVLVPAIEKALKAPEILAQSTKKGLSLEVATTWWDEFCRYVERCSEEWTRTYVGQMEYAISTTVLSAVRAIHAVVPSTTTERLVAPDPPQIMEPGARCSSGVPTTLVEIPSAAAALLQSVRSNLMVVMMFGSVVATIVGVLLAKVSNKAELTAKLMVAAIPVVVAVGIMGVRKQQRLAREKAVSSQLSATQGYGRAEAGRVFMRQRRALEKSETTRVELWTAALDRWWDQAVEPALGSADSQATDQARDLRLRQGKLQEEMAGLKAMRSQLGQNLLFELRRRLRDLQEMESEQKEVP